MGTSVEETQRATAQRARSLPASRLRASRRPLRPGPGLRLALALIAALAIVGFAAYLLVSDQLRDSQIDTYARIQAADVAALEQIAARAAPAERDNALQQSMEALAKREGTEEALLIGPDSVVRASGAGEAVGTVDPDPRTEQVLRTGESLAGNEADNGEDEGAFEFLSPLTIEGERSVLEVAYSGDRFDAQLADARKYIALTVAAAILAVLVLFYLLGGRALLRGYRRARERATRDGLTDLPNQRAFQDESERAVALAERAGEPLALALLDLDRFKQVNDRHGHAEGDARLRAAAALLADGRAADRAFRIGGDEFALLLPGTDGTGARTLTQRLARQMRDAGVSASVGVASLRAGQDVPELRAEADAALYEAKRTGGGRAASFEDLDLDVPIATAAKREGVERLVEAGEVGTVFQPIWSFDPALLVGIEAQSRPDPVYGLAGPEDAFEAAAQVGLVEELDRICAVAALRAAPAQLPERALLFLNLSPRTLELGAPACAWIGELVAAAGLEPGRVVIEVSEQIGARTDAVISSLLELRHRGFQLALDQVGTGNTGLELLRRVGADFVKLDRGVVGAAPTDPNARGVLMAMAGYARQTGAFVIADGIEDEETLDFLRGIEATDMAPRSVIQGGQGVILGAPAPTPSSAAGPSRARRASHRSAARSPSGG